MRKGVPSAKGGCSTKLLAAALAGGVTFAAVLGTASTAAAGGMFPAEAGLQAAKTKAPAASAAAKQYKRIIASLDGVLASENPPPIATIRGVFSSTEKKLSTSPWPSKARKDVKLLVISMKAAEPIAEKAATSAKFKPTNAQGEKLALLIDRSDTVRKDLGLKPNPQGTL